LYAARLVKLAVKKVRSNRRVFSRARAKTLAAI
jgi:hypothetical protein